MNCSLMSPGFVWNTWILAVVFGIDVVNHLPRPQNHQGRGGSVLVWAEINEPGKIYLVLVDGNMNVERYIAHILRPIVVPFAGVIGPNFVLMDDKAHHHRVRIVDNFVAAETITRMDPWPA